MSIRNTILLLSFIMSLTSLSTYGQETATVHNNKELFERAIFEVRDLYQSQIEQLPFEIRFIPQWEKNAVNSYTILAAKHAIFINGGMARAKHMTRDALILVVCHELGHNMGGAPQKPYSGGDPWSSAEAQSDYFAASKCLKNYFSEYYEEIDFDAVKFSPLALDRCRQVYGFGRDEQICLRVIKAGKATIAALSQEYLGHINQSVETPSTEVVSETNVQYPSMQCRLDTYFRGALCDIDPLSSEYCSDTEKSYGARPHCWYHP